MKRNILLVLLMALLIAACGNEDESVTLSAAASTRDALEEVVELFNIEHHSNIEMNFGGSGALKIQIEQGAPVDMFLSANINHFEKLEDAGFIEESIMYLGNRLVLIVPEQNAGISSIEELVEVNQLALGTPESVPAGEYAKAALEHYELWDEVEDNIIYAEDVRQVLQYVEIGEVDAGIVYHTDALTSDKVKIAATFDKNSHDQVAYPLGILNSGAQKNGVTDFYAFLQTDAALEVFRKYGFTTE